MTFSPYGGDDVNITDLDMIINIHPPFISAFQISSRKPSQIHYIKELNPFLKFDIGTSLLTTSIHRGITIQFAEKTIDAILCCNGFPKTIPI